MRLQPEPRTPEAQKGRCVGCCACFLKSHPTGYVLTMRTGILVAAVLCACSASGGDAKLVEKLTLAADMFDSQIKHLEESTTAGKPCYPVIDGWIHHKVQDFGTVIAKRALELEDRFNFCVVVFDAYKTSVGPRFEKLATRIDHWKEGPYAAASEACKRCAADEPNLGASCFVP